MDFSTTVQSEVRRRLTRRFGDTVEPWLEELPDRLAALQDRWNLRLREVIPRGSMSVVIRCQAPDDTRAVLKVSPDVQRLACETAGLGYWAGGHVPRVLDADVGMGALLLEEITPGTTLRDSGHYP